MLLSIPDEILQNIALELILINPVGLIPDLVPLLSTCTAIYRKLSLNHLYARMFRAKFDSAAPRRRLGPPATYSRHLARQLRTYCRTLKAIRTGDIYAPDVETTLWNAFFMMSENDGKNRVQAEWAHLEHFVDRFVRTRLNEDLAINNGWPSESHANALALWLMWYTADKDKLAAEPEDQRQQLIDIVLPYVVLACRYPASYTPPNHFNVPIPIDDPIDSDDIPTRYLPPSIVTAHGPYPLYRSPTLAHHTTHFGQRITLLPPLPAPTARLLYFARRQAVPVGIPPHLPPTRAHAVQIGHTNVAPTQEDIREFNAHAHVRHVIATTWDAATGEDDRDAFWPATMVSPSRRWDNDFNRWSFCYDPWRDMSLKGPTYTYGSLAGLWQGRLLVPNEPAYIQLITTPDRPPSFSERAPFVTTVPLYMTLREHHCVSPAVPLPIIGGSSERGVDEGLGSAWLPKLRFEERNGMLTLYDAEGNASHYETYQEGKPNSHDEDTCAMCIAAARKADEDQAFARREREGEFGDEEEDYDTDVDVDDEEGFSNNSSHADVPSHTHDARSTYSNDSLTDSDDADGDEYRLTLANTCSGICDILITGETELRHGQAWNHFKFFGRVRPWDGLVSIVRVPVNPQHVHFGRWVFTGYIVGAQNFVGTWRALGQSGGTVPSWEAAFVASKRE